MNYYYYYYYYYAVFNVPCVCQSMTKLQARETRELWIRRGVIELQFLFESAKCKNRSYLGAILGYTQGLRRCNVTIQYNACDCLSIVDKNYVSIFFIIFTA